MDISGCCILQKCIPYAAGSPQTAEAKDRFLAEITANAYILSENPYGYVCIHSQSFALIIYTVLYSLLEYYS